MYISRHSILSKFLQEISIIVFLIFCLNFNFQPHYSWKVYSRINEININPIKPRDDQHIVADQQVVSKTTVISSMFILVYEGNTCTKELFSEAVPHRFSSKVCPGNMLQIYRRRPIRKCNFKKCCVAHLHGCWTVNLLGICRTYF